MSPSTFTHAFTAEWIVLGRRRLWFGLVGTAVVLAALVTWLLVATSTTMGRGQTAVTLDVHAVTGTGGATAATMSAMGFTALLVVAAFAAAAGNDLARGTLRTAFLRQRSRGVLITGRLAARVSVALIVLAAAMVAGAVTTQLIALSRDLDTSAWASVTTVTTTAENLVRLIVFVAMYALIGTAVATVIRSTPIALGVLLVWFGPVENILGDGRAWARDWFPGLLLRNVLTPTPAGTQPTQVVVALAIYAVAAIATIAVVTRRDVTA
ncbi:ABC transporter permease [Gordonia sp. CPCC 206044]|uniref:ABC transporter permease n=1 Tax=Gordonia sp. CPCC 206044 TaxID=3140793 RepID=UPI003AF38D0E